MTTNKDEDMMRILSAKVIVHRPGAYILELVAMTDKRFAGDAPEEATDFAISGTSFWQDFAHVEAAGPAEPVPVKSLCQTIMLGRGEVAELAAALLDVLQPKSGEFAPARAQSGGLPKT